MTATTIGLDRPQQRLRWFAKRVAIVASVAVGMTPAIAGAQPYDQVDPMASGCSTGAYTVTSTAIRRVDTNAQVGVVELRWSPQCGTNWARVTPDSSVAHVLVLAEAQRPADNAIATYSVRFGTVWPIYTNMLNGSASCVKAVGYMTIDGPTSNVSALGETGCY